MMLGELLAERRVDLVEHGAGRGIGLGQLGAHADGLAALPGKYECDGHWLTGSRGPIGRSTGLNRVASLICA